jgi:hypothetical protein
LGVLGFIGPDPSPNRAARESEIHRFTIAIILISIMFA